MTIDNERNPLGGGFKIRCKNTGYTTDIENYCKMESNSSRRDTAIVNCQLSIVNSKRLPEIHSSLRLCTCQPASTSAFTTPRVLFILWSSSSSGSFRSMVSAEMVTTAVPLVGTMELMVMILAFASA